MKKRWLLAADAALTVAVVAVIVLALRKSPEPAPGLHSPPAAPAPEAAQVEAAKAGTVQLQLVARDGRAVSSCRVVSLGERRVIAEFDGASGGPPKVDLPAADEVRRLLVLPDDPALSAVLVEVDPAQSRYGPVAAVLPPGLETSGVVVNSRGEPLAGAVVSAEIPLDPDLPAKDEPFTELPRKGGTCGFNGTVLSLRATTDKEGRFQLDGLPESVTTLRAVHGKAQVEHAVAGDVQRIVVPD